MHDRFLPGDLIVIKQHYAIQWGSLVLWEEEIGNEPKTRVKINDIGMFLSYDRRCDVSDDRRVLAFFRGVVGWIYVGSIDKFKS